MNKLIWIVAFAGVSSTIASSVARADKAFRTGKGTAWDCKQDPVVSIDHGNAAYSFKGSCKTISVNGGHNTLSIENSATLNVTGGDNRVTIDAVDTINLIGSNNTVTYKSALHGDGPTVNKVGSNNVVASEGSGDKGGKPAKTAPADAAGAHDCAKNPTAVIDTGDGKYRFVGPCTRIVIDGGENTVEIESAKAVEINGSENTVTIGAADKITVLGGDNKVSYKKGLSGAKPKISSTGVNNTITQTK
jgi:hypothetical protein